MISSFSGEHRFLSNFYPSPFYFAGVTYPTVEHAFQAQKTTNHNERAKIAKLETPALAKSAGRQLDLRPDWENVKVRSMKALLWYKFNAHPDLAGRLIQTGDQPLVEGNTWHDQVWGNCTCSAHADTPGQNLLGTLLMEVRAVLISDAESVDDSITPL